MAKRIGSSEFARLDKETKILRRKKIQMADDIRKLNLDPAVEDLVLSYAEVESEYAEMMETLRWAKEQDD